MIGWAAIEAAITKWIREGGSFPVGHVIWADQGGARPGLPYVSVSVDDIASPGQDWRTTEYDEVEDNLKVTYHGHRVATLTLQCFGEPSGGPPSKGKSPLALLADVVSSLPVHEHDLDVAEVGIGNVQPVRMVSGSRGSILEPRAVVELQIHLASNLETRTDYIKRIQVTTSVKNVAGVALDDEEQWIPDPPP